MSFTQYYFPATEGMKLRSGKVINCIKNSYLYQDMNAYTPKNDYGGKYAFHCNPCRDVFILLEFLEKNYRIIRREPLLSTLYYSIPKHIANLINELKNPKKHCSFHENTRHYDPLFLDEYFDFDDLRARNEPFIGQEMKKYDGYKHRNMYRTYHLNFLKMAVRPHLNIHIESIYHDFNLLTSELKHWFKYFNRHNEPDLKKINSMLYEKTIHDCVNMISSYL